LEALIVIDAVFTTSRWTPSTGRGPCSGGAGAAGAPATLSLKSDAAGALSGRDGPAQADRTPTTVVQANASANQLRSNLDGVRLISATLPLAVSFDHLRWHTRPVLTGLRIYLAGGATSG
jgi:hypothetical protein